MLAHASFSLCSLRVFLVQLTQCRKPTELKNRAMVSHNNVAVKAKLSGISPCVLTTGSQLSFREGKNVCVFVCAVSGEEK